MVPFKKLAPQELEATTEGCVNARRDYIFGLWAGKALGHNDDALFAYVGDVMQADSLLSGTQRVVGKVVMDFVNAGINLGKSQIEQQLLLADHTAHAQICVTD